MFFYSFFCLFRVFQCFGFYWFKLILVLVFSWLITFLNYFYVFSLLVLETRAVREAVF